MHFNADDEVFYGKIAGVNDLVTFEGSTVADLATSFREAVEDYLVLCRTVGKSARKSYKGSFNVRIPTSLHRRAAEQATVRGISLNRLVQEALEREVGAHAGGGRAQSIRRRRAADGALSGPEEPYLIITLHAHLPSKARHAADLRLR